MGQQMELLNLHRTQFERILSSELNVDYLPEQVKALLKDGLTGIRCFT